MTTTLITLLVTSSIAILMRRFEQREEKYPNLLP